MQRSSLILVCLSWACFTASAGAAENYGGAETDLVPVDMSDSPSVAQATYYQPVETTYYGNSLTAAASAPSLPSTCGPCSPATTVYPSVTSRYGSATAVYSSPVNGCIPSYGACVPAGYGAARPVVAYRPPLGANPMPRDYYLGRGMIGQPVVYIEGQPVRNALRWFFP